MADAEKIAQLRAELAAAEAEPASPETEAQQAPVTVPAEGQAPAESSPAPDGTDVPESPAQETAEPEAEKLAEVVQTPSVETVVQAAEPVVTSALDALAAEKASNPQATFGEHLKALADKGLTAALNPADESAVLGAVVQLLKEVIA